MQEMADELGAHRAKEFNVGINPAKLGATPCIPPACVAFQPSS